MLSITDQDLFKYLKFKGFKPYEAGKGKLSMVDLDYINEVMPMIWVRLNSPPVDEITSAVSAVQVLKPGKISKNSLTQIVGYEPNVYIWLAVGQILTLQDWFVYVNPDSPDEYLVWEKMPTENDLGAERRRNQPTSEDFRVGRAHNDASELIPFNNFLEQTLASIAQLRA